MNTRIEQKIYEILGVRLFQKAVFCLERIVHFKDKQHNINYHFARAEEQENFVKYLFYNGAIHVRNIILIIILLLLKRLFFGFHYVDIVIVLFGIKDLYCIMLQRYNFIRIKDFSNNKRKIEEKRISRKVERMYKNNQYDYSFKSQDLEYINNLQKKLSDEAIVVISENDVESLDRLYDLLCTEGVNCNVAMDK